MKNKDKKKDEITFPIISSSLLGSLLDMAGQAGILSPRSLMDQAQSLKKRQLAELHEGGFLQILEKETVAFTANFDKVAKVLLDPRTNITFRFWGMESSWAESNLLFPGDVYEGDGVALIQVGRFYRITGFYDDEDISRFLFQILPGGSYEKINFEAHLNLSAASVFFALIDLYRQLFFSDKMNASESGFTEAEISGYLQGQWGLTQFDRLITYVTVSGMKPQPPAAFEVQHNLQILTDAGVIHSKNQRYFLSDQNRSMLKYMPGIIAGFQWQRVTLHSSEELLCSNRMFLFGDQAFTLSLTPTTRGNVHISTVQRENMIDFLITEMTSPHTIIPGGIGLDKMAVIKTAYDQKTQICPFCQETIEPDSLFCSSCGKTIKEEQAAETIRCCLYCNHPLEDDEVFCSNCGKKSDIPIQ